MNFVRLTPNQSAMILSTPSNRIFHVDGAEYTRADMVEANGDDADLIEWLDSAAVGEVFPAIVECWRVA